MSELRRQLLQLKQQEEQQMVQKGGERLMHYFYLQSCRPQDNNIEFWRTFVAEFFAPNAKKKWCFSIYGNMDHSTGVPPQNGPEWQCDICNRQPGRGFEANAKILPRLFQIKYESGLLEEQLHIENPQGYQHSCGLFMIHYVKALQTSVFNQLRIVREGNLRVIFTPELKISMLDFCAQSHDEFIARSSFMPQVNQLWDSAQKYLDCAKDQNRSTTLELQNTSYEFVASAQTVAKSMEIPSISEFGISNMYLRYLETVEGINIMKDLIDYSIETGSGPMESLANFPRTTSTVVEQQQQEQMPQ